MSDDPSPAASPGLVAATDPVRVLAALADRRELARGSLVPRRVRVRRVRPRPDGRVHVEYAVQLRAPAGRGREDVALWGTLHANPDDSAAEAADLASRVSNEADDERRRGSVVIHLPELCLVLRSPSLDAGLPGAATALDPERVGPLLDEALELPADRRAPWDVEILRQVRPGRRCTVAYRARGASTPCLIGKLYPDERRARRAFDLQDELWRGGFGDGSPVRVARPVLCVLDLALVLTEAVPSPSLRDVLRTGESPEPLAATGAALARLQASSVEARPGRTLAADVERLHAAAEETERVSPEVATRLRPHLDALAAADHTSPPDAALFVHGDFHAAHVLLGDDATTLLDLDRARRGDPTLDAGRLLADLAWMAVRAGWNAAAVDAAGAAFVAAWCPDLAPPQRAHLSRCRQAALLGLALSVLRRPHYRPLAPALDAALSRPWSWGPVA